MLRFFHFPSVSQVLIALLCMIAILASLSDFSPVAHAATRSVGSGPKYIQGPPIQCLDITASNAVNQQVVSVSNPPGDAVEYDLTLYVIVTSACPSNYLVTQITVESPVNISCPSGSQAEQPPPIAMSVPYGLYPGGGYGLTYTLVDRCVVYTNGKPTRSIVPSGITRDIDAQGITVNGNVRQNVTSNSALLNVW